MRVIVTNLPCSLYYDVELQDGGTSSDGSWKTVKKTTIHENKLEDTIATFFRGESIV